MGQRIPIAQRRSSPTGVWQRARALLAAALALATLLGLPSTAGAQPSSPGPPFPTATVGVVGCSNTHQHVEGYLAHSELDQLSAARIGGLGFEAWGDPAFREFDSAWRKFDAARPAGGYQAVWVQMCIRDGTADPNDLLEVVVDQIHKRDPGIPIYVSPLNQFPEGHVCNRIGPQGFEIAQATAEWGVANLEVQRGPITGPIDPSQLASGDNCHLGPAGVELVGTQLVSWFDGGAAGATPLATDPLAVVLRPLCAVVDPLVSVGVIAPIPPCDAQ